MARQGEAQKATVARVMHQYKHGALPFGKWGRVRSPKPVIAIAPSEAGASGRQTPVANRRRPARTRAGEHAANAGDPVAGTAQTRADLYWQAQEPVIRGHVVPDATNTGERRERQAQGG